MIVNPFFFSMAFVYMPQTYPRKGGCVNRCVNRKIMSVTIAVVCFKSKTLANGEHPLMLRITQDRKRVMKSLGISVSPQHWDFVKGEPKPKCPNKELIQNIILKVKAE